MARLEKLLISGIRSFSPEEGDIQTIIFGNPVTLILGVNGSGKTTIIESIKYACTGEMPPDISNGQSFVNDPKMTNRVRSKAQIKLQLKDPAGNKVLIWRGMEVLQKAAGLKFESKAPTLKITDPDGEVQSLAGRCADINAQCCQILNVSPAILNNVIFCHQESSLWPLEEGKKLKERFDKIFESDRYNKCSDLLKKEITKREVVLKTTRVSLKYLEDIKNNADSYNRRLVDRQDKLNSLKTDIQDRQQQSAPINDRIKEICAMEDILVGLQSELATKKEKKKGLTEQQSTIRENIKFEFEGTDEELREKISKFDEDKLKKEREIDILSSKKVEVEDKIRLLNQKIQDLQNRTGKLEGEKAQFEKKCAERISLIEQAKDQLNLKVNTEEPKRAIKEIKEVIEEAKLAYEKLTQEKENEEKKLQKVIDEARENYLSVKHNIETKSEEIVECEKKYRTNATELKDAENSQESLKKVNNKIQSIEKTLNSLKDLLKETEVQAEIEDNKRKIQSKENDLDIIESELKVLQENMVTEERLEFERQTVSDKQRQINSTKNKHSENFDTLFKNNIPVKDFQEKVTDLQKIHRQIVDEYNDKMNKTQKIVTTMEAKLSNYEKQIKKCKEELQKKQNEIYELCLDKDFDEVLDESYKKKEQLQRDKGQYSSAKVMYEAFIKEFEKEKPCCPICQTKFDEKRSAAREVIQSLRRTIEAIPYKLDKVEKELKAEEERYDKLQQLKPIYEDVVQLKNNELPALNSEQSEISEELQSKKETLDQLKSEIKEPAKIVEICQKVISDATLLDQNIVDKAKAERAIEKLKEQLVEVPSNRSKQEAETEIDSLRADIANLRKSNETLATKMNKHNERCKQLIKEKGDVLEKKMELEKVLHRIPVLETQNEELKDKIRALQNETVELKQQLNKQKEELKKAEKNKDELEQDNKIVLLAKHDALDSNKNLLMNIIKVQLEIEVYLKKKIDEVLRAANEELESIRTRENTFEVAKNKLIEEITNKREDLAKEESNYRAFQDNLTLREKQKQEILLGEEIKKLRTQIGSHNYSTVHREKQELLKKLETLQAEINTIMGQKQELQKSISELKADLEKPENKNAYKNYRSKYYEKVVAEMIIEDMKKYRNALDNGVVQFHKSKMVEINEIIRSYWRAVYRGNDIDFIEIKTDDHINAAGTRRSYNYRVVQVKNRIELDMRGRCSAGQKVLACLIIRMALSETFSTNCGILTLDEPTTNLDKENIVSLCEHISRIIVTRSQEKNFQLIVITHDEDFLNTMARTQSVSNFYRVSRNPQGFSQVQRENL